MPFDDSKGYFVVGGAGFVGSHLVERLLRGPGRVTVFDNFSSGSRDHLREWANCSRLTIVEKDAANRDDLIREMRGHDVVAHLAANPDLSKAQTDPDLDFRLGTLLTRNVLEAMRSNGVKEIWYTSGSGVYGDQGLIALDETFGPLLPVSPYGASKLACEALIAAYSSMFEIRAHVFRFANLVGPRQTHGVGFDFLRKLKNDPKALEILGDGNQSKSYLHIDDALDAVELVTSVVKQRLTLHNVTSEDTITVTEIAKLATECLGLPSGRTKFRYTGGKTGWPGDVPIVRLDGTKLRALGWAPRRNSREALEDALRNLE